MPGRLKETPSIKRARQRAIDAQRKKNRLGAQASADLYSEEESKKRIRKSRMKSAGKAGRRASSTAILKFSGGY